MFTVLKLYIVGAVYENLDQTFEVKFVFINPSLISNHLLNDKFNAVHYAAIVDRYIEVSLLFFEFSLQTRLSHRL